jgi:hypothetical protein
MIPGFARQPGQPLKKLGTYFLTVGGRCRLKSNNIGKTQTTRYILFCLSVAVIA